MRLGKSFLLFVHCIFESLNSLILNTIRGRRPANDLNKIPRSLYTWPTLQSYKILILLSKSLSLLYFFFYFYFFNNIFINELLRGSTRFWSVQSYNGKEMMQLWCSLDWKSPSFLFVLLWFIWPGFEPTQPFGRENITYISHTVKI